MNDALTPFLRTVTVGRRTTPSVVKGVVQPVTPTFFTIEASVQQARPKDLQQLPEHDRTTETIVLHSETKLRTVDEKNGLPADVVQHDGQNWKVVAVSTHQSGVLDHYKMLAQRT